MSTKMATGIAKAESGKQAALQALEQAKGKLGNVPIHLVVVYSSPAYDHNEVVQVVRSATDRAPLIGSSTAGEFTEQGVETKSVVVSLLSSDSIQFHTASATGLRENVEGTILDLAEKVPKQVEGYPHLGAILLADGLAGVGEEITLLASNAFGPVQIFGGAASDDFQMKATHVFHDDQVLNDSVVFCLMASKAPFFTAVAHGHTAVSESLKVTKAKGNVIYEVDGRPAWEVWKEKTRESAAKNNIDTSQLTEASDIGKFFANYELGLKVGENAYKMRWPSGINDDGSINFTCGIVEGSVFNIMDGSRLENLIEASGKAAETAKEKAKDAGFDKFAGMLVFECGVRAIMLGDQFYKGVERFKQVMGDVPLAGFESYGEICLEPGKFSGYHNTTSVVVLIPDS